MYLANLPETFKTSYLVLDTNMESVVSDQSTQVSPIVSTIPTHSQPEMSELVEQMNRVVKLLSEQKVCSLHALSFPLVY